MSGELGPAQLEAWRAFLETHAAIVAALERELLAERDLPLSWYDVLYQLKAHSGRMRMSELARAVLLSKSGLTRLIDRLVRAGYVGREVDSLDRRGVCVQLTSAGESAQRRAAPVHLRGVQHHFGAFLEDSEANYMTTLLARMSERDTGSADTAH
jgi:DNA-binding MarR family transcriptional regulator